MERKQDEKFEDYKLRRSIANQVTRNINWKTKHQYGVANARTQLRNEQKDNPSYHGGVYGLNILAKFARDRIADGVLPAKHQQYVARQVAKKASRNLVPLKEAA
jgi:hypothetical protein